MKISGEQILNELYNVDLNALVRLQELSNKYNVKWYDLMLWNEDYYEQFINYILEKYKLKPKIFWSKEIRYLIYSYGPTTNKYVYESASEKVKDIPGIKEILNKVRLWKPIDYVGKYIKIKGDKQ